MAVELPDLFLSLLDRLADRLPPPIYSLLVSFFYRSLDVLSPILSLLPPLPSSQEIVSPLLTLLCAYLALLTLYRTATWAIRTFVWFLKWGILLTLLGIGLGWHLGNIDLTQGVMANVRDTVIRTVLESANAREVPGGTDGPRRPRPWDSYESHRHWREHAQEGADNGIDPKNVIKSIADMASGFLDQGGQWWTAEDGERMAEQGNRQHSSRRAKHRSR